ncbi:low affinity immunoglobulin epsilon Fc receptor-like [Amphiprion ocellaris]|uniref:C-type lectin domain-containing protein n=1 Tax=Amphiprion ocellaris TaxID=80972 RepID=A0A3Q1AP63_AMPOC|nr:low affinity immunoglobulin epsilon Fc receptor-like [Amphiprion ocellaris]
MSMAMINKSEEAEEDTWSTMTPPDKRSKYGWRSQCPVWWIRAAAVCLGLLLLLVILGLVAHNASAIGQQDSLLDHLMKREKLIHNLTTDNSALRDELNQMKVKSSRLTKEMEELQREYKTVVASRDHLLQEYTTLNSSSAYALASAISQQHSLLDDLKKREKLIHNLTTDNSALRDELNQTKVKSSRLTKEMEELQREYKTVAASRDHLQEVKMLNSNTTCKVCPSEWIPFDNKCYYASPRGKTKNWEDSRKDCLQRGADLVMPTTREELNFVTRIYDRTWIGLSDKKNEGKWLWVDGSELQTGFWQTGEPNNERNEDCAEISRTTGEWNDVLCSSKLPWICED